MAIQDRGPAAIYARLSVNENGERDESLETQCRLLQSYAAEKELSPVSFYVDNDISGTCFDRPGLSRLVQDIEDSIIRIILVKDLSRLGRNNGETLTFLDFLVEKNIRLISLGDNYDSFKDDDEVIGIKTWVNEHYARDISKKVRYNLKRKKEDGQFLGRPPFGYQKCARQKNKLVVDERYREIIQQVFALYIDGQGYRALAACVQAAGIPTPSQDKGYRHAPQSSRWNEQHIRRLITNRVYCGDTVQGVSEKVSFKSKKTRRLGPEKWIIVPGTHEAIISRDLFDLAQEIRKKRRHAGPGRKNKKSGRHLFTGFIICGSCGGRHIFRQRKNRPPGYICGHYHRLGRQACSSHHIAEQKLLQYIQEDIQTMAAAVPFSEKFQKKILGAYLQGKGGKNNIDAQIKDLERKIAAEKQHLQAVYLDKIKGIISGQLFLDSKGIIEKELRLLQDRVTALKNDLHTIKEQKTLFGQKLDLLTPGPLNEIKINRTFLEKYIKKIIITTPGAPMGTGAREYLEKHGLCSNEAPWDKGAGVIIVYKIAGHTVGREMEGLKVEGGRNHK